jgi:hypothetical protein
MDPLQLAVFTRLPTAHDFHPSNAPRGRRRRSRKLRWRTVEAFRKGADSAER